MGGNYKSITEAASILGLTVIGALIPTVCNTISSYCIPIRRCNHGSSRNIRTNNAIFSSSYNGFLCILVTRKEEDDFYQAIWILLALSIILGALGVLA